MLILTQTITKIWWKFDKKFVFWLSVLKSACIYEIKTSLKTCSVLWSRWSLLRKYPTCSSEWPKPTLICFWFISYRFSTYSYNHTNIFISRVNIVWTETFPRTKLQVHCYTCHAMSPLSCACQRLQSLSDVSAIVWSSAWSECITCCGTSNLNIHWLGKVNPFKVLSTVLTSCYRLTLHNMEGIFEWRSCL